MKRLIVLSAALILLCLSIAPAHAQERGQVGLTMAMPASIGFIWHPSDNLAVRPEFTFTFGSAETETPVGETTSDGSAFELGASVLFYTTAGTDAVRTYIAPRLAFSRTSYGENDDSVGGVAISGSFGAQYTPVRRFSIFGEVGIEYTRRSSSFDTGVGEFEARFREISPRTSVGVILYLGG